MLSAPIWPNEERLAKAVGHDREWVLQERFVTHHPAGWRVLVLMVEKPERCRGAAGVRSGGLRARKKRGAKKRGAKKGARGQCLIELDRAETHGVGVKDTLSCTLVSQL